MPGNVEGQRLHGRRIRQVVKLLKNQSPKDCVEVLAGAPEVVAEMGSNLYHGKVGQQVFTEDTCPRAFKEPAPRRPKYSHGSRESSCGGRVE